MKTKSVEFAKHSVPRHRKFLGALAVILCISATGARAQQPDFSARANWASGTEKEVGKGQYNTKTPPMVLRSESKHGSPNPQTKVVYVTLQNLGDRSMRNKNIYRLRIRKIKGRGKFSARIKGKILTEEMRNGTHQETLSGNGTERFELNLRIGKRRGAGRVAFTAHHINAPHRSDSITVPVRNRG